eukprot:TRINITY_DN6171_c0_g1_i3.p1 TRINITY_DN6171_c0_g1~~TRINITY_DN6171_c0_g1_i3.p1  ORF type:complete len:168 (-),score=15.38 TRINITY_DN6171_c0_g1_i3:153-656(-)
MYSTRTARGCAGNAARLSRAEIRVPKVTPHTASDARRTVCRSLGSDITKGFFDLSQLVASDTAKKGAFDDLAYHIGRDAYADLNGWHLFLKDMSTVPGGPKMSTLLAEQLGTMVLTNGVDEREIEDFLKKVPVKLGSGKTQVSLDDVLPNMAVRDIVRACQDFQKDN